MAKVLITSGCSFSECASGKIDTWPTHLYRLLKMHDYTEHISSAMGSQGNGLISRGVIYNCTKALEKYKAKDILVGIMWTGSDRYDFRCTEPSDLQFIRDRIHNGWIENPTGFVNGSTKNWVILNPHWGLDLDGHRNTEAKMFYKYFYDDIGMSIRSIEHILRVQLFLKSKSIPYFFTDYKSENIVLNKDIHHSEIKYLYDEIDREYYLPVENELDWVWENTKFKHLWSNPNIYDQHPMTEMHKEFVDQVVYPWLIKNNKV